MNKSNKRLVGTFAVFALCCAATVVGATEIEAVGPIEAVQSRTQTVVVLGQSFVSTRAITGRDGRLGALKVGDYVAISGIAVKEALVAKSIVALDVAYVPGSSKVLYRGPIDRYSASIGNVQIGGLQISLSQILSDGLVTFGNGDIVNVVGTQALPKGLVWASQLLDPSDSTLVANAVTALSIQGTGLLSIQGTGTQSIQGTGVQSIQGTGVQSIQGTGAQSIQGTGVQSIQGTGALSIQGTGKQSIQGTGTQSIQGTGKLSIQGTGALSIQGTGALSIQGTGKQSIQGTGVRSIQVTGSH